MPKEKTEGLTPEEKVEQAKLREGYIEGYRRTVRHHIEGSKLWTKKETMLHQRKLRQVQREKVYMAVVLMIQIHNKYSFF